MACVLGILAGSLSTTLSMQQSTRDNARTVQESFEAQKKSEREAKDAKNNAAEAKKSAAESAQNAISAQQQYLRAEFEHCLTYARIGDVLDAEARKGPSCPEKRLANLQLRAGQLVCQIAEQLIEDYDHGNIIDDELRAIIMKIEPEKAAFETLIEKLPPPEDCNARKTPAKPKSESKQVYPVPNIVHL